MYKCQYCEHKAVTEDCLTRHSLTVHEEGTPYPCNKCDLVAGKQEELTRHYKSKHEK